ncbi:acetoacetyl-CoA synthetase [Nephila pilipes]|uniref:Acetoacetyl-CoA synthetase n=1 Tax=Nephila pilipes TaxID=299642 RepID=A0A8X6THD2_NEPPI|nr:acetoacetyl-CoA synthetase [Nephila pilipes]
MPEKLILENNNVNGTCEDKGKIGPIKGKNTVNGTYEDKEKIGPIKGVEIPAAQIRKRDAYLAWNKKVSDTGTEKFKKVIEEKYNLKLDSYWDLHRWSIDNCENFWAEIWDYFNVIYSKNYEKVLEKTGPGFLDNKWFTGARLNYAENLLRIRDDRVAIASFDEDGNLDEITYAQLYEEVKLYAAAFRRNGLEKGDRVCCMMNNRKEAIIGCLAAASIGAMWSGIQSSSGAKAAAKIANRMEPKFLIVSDSFLIHDLEINILDKVPTIVESSPTIEKVIVLPLIEKTLIEGISHIRNGCFLNEFLESGKELDGSIPDLIFEQLPFDHPLFLMCTSGTTGLPKAPVHGAGTFLPLFIDIAFHWNLKPGDSIYSHIPMGWAVWSWFLPCLALGVKMLLYSGSDLAIKHGLNCFDRLSKYKATWWFVEPGTLDITEKENVTPSPNSNFDHLKYVCICGSPVKVQNIRYLQSKIKKDLFVGSLYGTTESHGFLSGFDYNLPSYAGEIQVPALGKDIYCYDKTGRPVIGQLGELVLTARSPSFPLYLWKDEDGSVINKTYLSKFPGAWSPSDECWIRPQSKGIIIVGRSDDMLTQHGECFGSADIYFAIHDMEEIEDYICVGQTDSDGTVRVVLFVKLKKGLVFTPELREKISQKILRELWFELVPEVILDTKDIPYNLNGKRMESTIKKIVNTNQIPENITDKKKYDVCTQLRHDIILRSNYV